MFEDYTVRYMHMDGHPEVLRLICERLKTIVYNLSAADGAGDRYLK